MSHVTQVQLRLWDSESVTAFADVVVCFAELERCSDALLLGVETLASLGYRCSRDDDGNYWAHFDKLGIVRA